MYSTIRFGTASKATPLGRRLYRAGVGFELAIKRSPARCLDHLATTSLKKAVTQIHFPEWKHNRECREGGNILLQTHTPTHGEMFKTMIRPHCQCKRLQCVQDSVFYRICGDSAHGRGSRWRRNTVEPKFNLLSFQPHCDTGGEGPPPPLRARARARTGNPKPGNLGGWVRNRSKSVHLKFTLNLKNL